jgi:hypothetical protein
MAAGRKWLVPFRQEVSYRKKHTAVNQCERPGTMCEYLPLTILALPLRRNVHPGRAFASLVNEVDANALNFCPKVRELIELLLLLSPIEGSLPISDELLQISEISTRAPVGAIDSRRPSRLFKPSPQVGQHTAMYFDLERTNIVFHHGCLDAFKPWMEDRRLANWGLLTETLGMT